MARRSEPSDVLVMPRWMATKLAAQLEPQLFSGLVRLYELADRTWPYPAQVPRWADQQLLEQLHQEQHITLDGDEFTCTYAQWNRERQTAWHSAGGKARAGTAVREGGRFTSSDQQAPAAAGAPPAYDGGGGGGGGGDGSTAVPSLENARANGADGPPAPAVDPAAPTDLFYATSDGRLGRRQP